MKLIGDQNYKRKLIPPGAHLVPNELPKDYQEFPKTENPDVEPVSFKGNFIKSDYIQIPNQNFIIAIAETNKNLTYEQAHIKTLKQNLIIPDSNQFMIFHNYFHEAYKNNKPIFDAAGNAISNNTKQDLYNQLTSDCWTWLNGMFYISDKGNFLEKVIGINPKDKLITTKEKLENCLMQDCYIDFTKLTKQGLASTNSKYSNQNFEQGKNIKFWKPTNGGCLLYTSPSPRDLSTSRMPSSA